MTARFPEAHLREVAIVRAPKLDRRADPSGRTRVWLALEALQITGSFKVRGAIVALDRVLRAQGPGARVVSASRGNHGRGVAYAARVLGLEATILVPPSSPRAGWARIAREANAVVLSGSDDRSETEAEAAALAEEIGASFISACDDIDVVSGNGGSLGFEIVRGVRTIPDIVFVPLGGGGLATGLAHALATESEACRVSRRVWGVQSEASPTMALSLERGEAVEPGRAAGPTLATRLQCGISKAGFARAREAIAGVVVVRESQIAEAMDYCRREMGLVIEGSAAASLAPVLHGLPEDLLTPPGHVSNDPVRCPRNADLVVVLTGRNIEGGELGTLSSSRRSRPAYTP
jgi:threonine dehydratase